MAQNELLQNQQFWKALEFLLGLKEEVSVEYVCDTLELDQASLNTLLLFVGQLGLSIKFISSSAGDKLRPSKNQAPELHLHLDLFKWCQLQSLFPQMMKHINHTIFQGLIDELSQARESHRSGFLSLIERWDQDLADIFVNKGGVKMKSSRTERTLASRIEKAMVEQCAVYILFHKAHQSVFPRKLVYIDGRLCLIGEDTQDRCLISLDLHEVEDIERSEDSYICHFSELEIEDFINGVRSISDNEVRLILKIKDHAHANLIPEYHYLGNPCLVVNSEGNYIWAANVEPSEALFDWLYKERNVLEVVDPSSFRQDFINYCHQREKQDKVA